MIFGCQPASRVPGRREGPGADAIGHMPMCQMTSRDDKCLGVGASSRTAASSVAGRLLCGRGAIALWVAYPVLNCSYRPAARATAQMYGGREAARIDSAIKCRAAERRDPQNVARS